MTIYLGLALLIGIAALMMSVILTTRHKLKNASLNESLCADACANCKTCLCWSCMPADQPGAEIYKVNK